MVFSFITNYIEVGTKLSNELNIYIVYKIVYILVSQFINFMTISFIWRKSGNVREWISFGIFGWLWDLVFVLPGNANQLKQICFCSFVC